jgi:MFS family permease
VLSSREWRVLALLVISGFLNYIDRANLSVGATDIQRELHISSYHLGLLLSAFFWTYALLQVLNIAGWVTDRFNVCWVLAVGFFLWSGATAVTGLAQGFALVFGLRLVLGMGESIAYPCYSRILANHVPEHHRGFANALIDAGTKTGPALGTLLGGLLMARFGWRAFFIALGFTTMLWLVPWYFWMPRGKGVSARDDPREIPGAFEILRERSAIFSALGLFCANYFWYFLVTWLPAYLETERRFPKTRMAVMASVAFFTVAATAIVCGWVSDRMIARGAAPTRVRKAFTGTGLALATVILPAGMVADTRIAMALLLVSAAFYGVFCSNLWAITQTIAGPRAAGKWTGLQNGIGNFAGVASPWLTGFVVQRTGQFYLAFVVAAAVALTGAAIFVFGIGPVKQVQWKRQPAVAVLE